MKKNFNFAFTLAEVLIIMSVIGVVAMFTVPQLVNGTQAAQYKAAYKKAYTIVYHVASIEKAHGRLPKAADETSLINFFKAMDKNLEVEGYADRMGDGKILKIGSTHSGMVWKEIVFGDENDTFVSAQTDNRRTPWIITADDIAFCVTVPEEGTCEKSSKIDAQTTTASEAVSKSCIYVIVDTNGLYKGPNIYEPQIVDGLVSNQKMKKLTGDRFIIYIARDGVARGSELLTVSGRLLSD